MAITYLHAYRQLRGDVDWNTCGQAAVATITDYWGRNPFGLPRDTWDGNNGRYYWDDGRAIDAVKDTGYGPDVPYGYGTTGGRINDALRSYGMWSEVGFSGWGTWGWRTSGGS